MVLTFLSRVPTAIIIVNSNKPKGFFFFLLCSYKSSLIPICSSLMLSVTTQDLCTMLVFS